MEQLHQIAVSGGTLAVQVWGDGPTVLFVHGFPLDHQMWSGQFALADQFRCVLPDLRGFGASQADVPAVLSMTQHAEDLQRILDHFAPNESVYVCGLSMGGYVAFELWSRCADRIRKMVLCDTRTAGDSIEAARAREMAAQKIVQQGSNEFVSGMLGKLFGPSATSDCMQAVERVMQTTAPASLAAALLGMSQRTDFTDRLPEITIPTLLLGGKYDAITPPSEMSQVAAAMPKAAFLEIDGAGHMAPLEQPEPVNAAIQHFIS